MRDKKGFTLIELIAVIAVLAIIALIIVPTITTMMKETRKNAFEDTAYGLIKAANQYHTKKDLLSDKASETVFEFPNKVEGLEVTGELPESGYIKIDKDGKVTLAISNGRYCATKTESETKVTVTDDVETCGLSNEENNGGNNPNTLTSLATTETGVSIPTCVTKKTTCAAGEKVAIKVNDTDVYNFYVIDDNNSNVTLIMDRNIGSQVAWTSKSDYTTAGGSTTDYGDYGNNNLGPITVLNYLNIQTSSWNNIGPIESYTYDNNLNGTANKYGYQKLTITNGTGVLTSQDGTKNTTLAGTMRARLLTNEEASTLKTNNNGTMPTWLYENLSSSNTTAAPYGYWLLTAYPFTSSDGRSMNYSGNISFNFVYNDSVYGARPVIELSK